MRVALTFALLIGAAFLAFWSVSAALIGAGLAILVGHKAGVRSEEVFTAILFALAGAGILGQFIQQGYYLFTAGP